MGPGRPWTRAMEVRPSRVLVVTGCDSSVRRKWLCSVRLQLKGGFLAEDVGT
jgi:hypothetical protein